MGVNEVCGALTHAPSNTVHRKSKNSDTTLGLGLSVQDLLSTVCPFCPQLFLDDSKMKNFITCFKGIACCAAPASLSPSAPPGLQLPDSAGSPQPQGSRQSHASAGVPQEGEPVWGATAPARTVAPFSSHRPAVPGYFLLPAETEPQRAL